MAGQSRGRAASVAAVTWPPLPPARSFADVEPVEEALRQRGCGCAGDGAAGRAARRPPALPAPTGDHDEELLAAWFADWDTYLQDRRDHLADWQAGQDRPFAETEADTGGPISNRMDALAREAGCSCEVPGDLG